MAARPSAQQRLSGSAAAVLGLSPRAVRADDDEYAKGAESVSGFMHVYHRHILEPGKQPLVLLFLSFIVAFLFIRLSVRMIRAEVSWWPGNVQPGGLHIHHVVFGTALLIVTGVVSFAPLAQSLLWQSVLGAGFGIGAALVLDEFALILHLQDVYWTAEGRTSVDAVFVGVALTGLLLLGAAPFGVNNLSASEEGGGWAVTVSVLLNAVFVVITFAKGKVWTGLVGLLVPVFALVGTIRAARPSSLWARRFYGTDTYRMHRALHREAGFRRRVTRARTALSDAVAGKPDA